MVSAMMRSAGWVLCVWVFANQGGVPVPVVPSLVLEGMAAPEKDQQERSGDD
jgi:hypothetical protein